MAGVGHRAFVAGAVGGFCALRQIHSTQARLYLRAGTFAGLIDSLLVAFPTGDQQAKMVGRHQPVTLAAMEGKFTGGCMAGVSDIWQPNIYGPRPANPVEDSPSPLSFPYLATLRSPRRPGPYSP